MMIQQCASTASPPPLLPLGYVHLAFFIDTRCTLSEHEWAVKQLLYIRTLGIAHIRGFASRAPIFQMMQSLAIKRRIWRYLDVAKPVALAMEIVAPTTSEFSSTNTVTKMLVGTELWLTKTISTDQSENVVLGVAAGSLVTSLDVATYRCTSDRQMCVEEVAADGTVGAMLITWKHYGTHSEFSGGSYEPSDYTPATIAVETTATRFKVSIRHAVLGDTSAGLAIFRATGVAPPLP